MCWRLWALRSQFHRKKPELLEKIGICFLFAQNYHIAMKYVAPIRKELGIRTVFNILGPLSNPEMSLYLSDQLKMVDLSSTFGKVAIVYEKLQNGRYVGNADDSNKAVKYINDNLLRKRLRGISTESRSAIFIGIARIISDSRENSSALNEDKVAADEVKRYVARYARYSADALIEKFATVDSARFLYIQALRYLVSGDDGNINASINMIDCFISLWIQQIC